MSSWCIRLAYIIGKSYEGHILLIKPEPSHFKALDEHTGSHDTLYTWEMLDYLSTAAVLSVL